MGLGLGSAFNNGYEHRYALPQRYINQYYNGYYPYWGYGLGYDEQLVTLADSHEWKEIAQKLGLKQQQLQAELYELEKNRIGNKDRILKIEDHLAKIQLHLDALQNE